MPEVRSYSLKRTKDYAQQGGSVRFHVETEGPDVVVELTICAPGVVRYRVMPSGAPQPDAVDLLAPEWRPIPAEVATTEQGTSLVLKAHGTVVVVERDQWRVAVQGPGGRTAFVEGPLDVNVRGVHVSLPTGFDIADQVLSRCWVTFALQSDEHLFGLGEKFTDLDKRGQRIRCWNRNPAGAGTELAYKNVPFLVSTRHYGLFLNDTRRSTWSLGNQSNFAATVELEGDEMDLFILVGDSMKDILGKYADLTGHAPLPPRWSFGVWLNLGATDLPWGQLNQTSMLQLAEEVRRRQLPCDVLHIDTYWMGDAGYCCFEWDRQRWPDPEGMVRGLRQRGFRLCLWESPYIDVRTQAYQEAAEKGYLLKRADGSPYVANLVWISPPNRTRENRQFIEQFYDPGGIYDYSNPQAVEWLKEKHRQQLRMGVATFKPDFGEEIPADAHFSNGRTGMEMHNAYPLLYQRAVFETIGEFTEKPFIWGRSGFAGIQRTPVQWSGDPAGDFPSLAATVRGGLSYGMSGVPFWACDLGGFRAQRIREAYVRWVQTGLLVSHCRYEGSASGVPWLLGEDVFQIIKRYHELRYRLLPYLCALALEASRRGVPVMRPLALEFENDPGSLATDLEFMLGPSLLVAPVLNSEGIVNVYLPPGTWYDLWTGEKHTGPVVLERKVGLDTVPIYIRGSAILPTTEVAQTADTFWDSLTIDLYPSANGDVEVPEEDGRRPTHISIRRRQGARVRASGPARSWRFLLHDAERPAAVSVSARAKATWRYLARSRTIEVNVGRCQRADIAIQMVE